MKQRKEEKNHKKFMGKYNNNTLLDDEEIDKILENYNYNNINKNTLGSYQHLLDNENNNINDDYDLSGKENDHNILNNNELTQSPLEEKPINEVKVVETEILKEDKKVEIVKPKVKTKEELEEEERQKV